MDIGLLGAFLGGILTLLSPCSAMLLPAFFSYAFARPTELLARTGIFYLGLITSLVPLGVLAGTFGAFVNEHRFTFVTVASVIVIALGLVMVLNIPVPLLARRETTEGTSNVAVYALGTVYGLAGVCAGPILGAVLTIAAVSGNALSGGIILLAFAAGMALPLLIASLLWGRLPFVKRLIRPREIIIGCWRNTWTGLIGGLLTVGVGVLLLVTSGTTSLSGILGASDQFALEGTVLREAARISDGVVIGVACVAALIGWVIVRVSKKRAIRESSLPSPTPPIEENSR